MSKYYLVHHACGLAALLLVGACASGTNTSNGVPAADPAACAGEGCDPATDPPVSEEPEQPAQTDGTTSRDAGAGRDTGNNRDANANRDTGANPNTGTTPGGGGGVTPAIDRVNCYGPASSSGTVLGATPAVTTGTVLTDPARGIQLILVPRSTLTPGDLSVGVYFTPYPGQTSYPPNGSVGCVVLRYANSGWTVVDKTQLCEVTLAQLTYASAPNVCDGTLGGTFRGVFGGNATLDGSFVLPLNIAASQVRMPSCRPRDASCTKDAECCSGSCSRFVGVCN
jgi:hypothetical protein